MFYKHRMSRAVCVMLAALLMFTSTGCGKSSGSGKQTPTETEGPDYISEHTVTIPIPENAAEIYEAVMATKPEPQETSPEEAPDEEETIDCEYTRTGKPAVALTFDDGPRAGSTDKILDVLEKYNARATFFIVGNVIGQNPDALKREVELGCELGSHTWSHEDLTKIGESGVNSQMDRSVSRIEETSGGKVTVMRPPYGAIDSDVKSYLDLPIILWSLDTLDWKTRDAASTLQVIQDEVRGGDIILMHDIHPETADAVEKIVPWLIDNGYELVTVTELYEYYGKELDLHKGHGSAR